VTQFAYGEPSHIYKCLRKVKGLKGVVRVQWDGDANRGGEKEKSSKELV